jgi:hypothetical protein
MADLNKKSETTDGTLTLECFNDKPGAYLTMVDDTAVPV